MEQLRLRVRKTATGFWVVERGSVQVGSGPTRKAAEAERNLFERLWRARPKRSLAPRRPRF